MGRAGSAEKDSEESPYPILNTKTYSSPPALSGKGFSATLLSLGAAVTSKNFHVPSCSWPRGNHCTTSIPSLDAGTSMGQLSSSSQR